MTDSGKLGALLASQESNVLEAWLQQQSQVPSPATGSPAQLKRQSSEFLSALRSAIQRAPGGSLDSAAWEDVKRQLGSISAEGARRGATPTQTATFVFSLKQALFDALRKTYANDASAFADASWEASTLLDRLGLYTTEVHQQSREEVIHSQQQEMLELTTPVVELWDNILALPLIGTLDSNRTQVVMENLLQKVVETGSSIAILDITGVPTVDTLVAQHLLKTVAAARLMGAECIISGIRPQIAQTIVHLGVDLSSVITKSSLADAFKAALAMQGTSIVRQAEVK